MLKVVSITRYRNTSTERKDSGFYGAGPYGAALERQGRSLLSLRLRGPPLCSRFLSPAWLPPLSDARGIGWPPRCLDLCGCPTSGSPRVSSFRFLKWRLLAQLIFSKQATHLEGSGRVWMNHPVPSRPPGPGAAARPFSRWSSATPGGGGGV